uniref:PDZ domain-containing protein n=1 Tax=Anopheles epiroticus TaxID=199890 RepID=A0A182PAX2_9DIPT
MEKYVTVVSVDDQLLSPIVPPPIDPVVIVASSGTSADRVVELSSKSGGAVEDEQQAEGDGQMEQQDDSQFVTVLSINHGAGGPGRQSNAPEVVLVYRLPGERLGFGLKFQGGTKSNEKIQRLFIQSCAENSPASRVQASWGHLREGDEILEIDGVSVSRMTRIECVKCLKDSNVAIKLLVRNGEGKVRNFYGEMLAAGGVGATGTTENGGVGGGGGGGGGVVGGEIPERKGAPPPPPPVPPRKLNKRKQMTVEQPQQNGASTNDVGGGGPPSKQMPGTALLTVGGGSSGPVSEPLVPPPDADTYSNLFAADDISDLISESDDTASTISTVVDKFSICSSLSSEDYTIPSHGGPAGIGASAELAKALKPFTLLEQEFNLESKFETTNLFTFKPPPSLTTAQSNVVQLEVPAAEKPPTAATSQQTPAPSGEYENVTIMKVDENRNYENVTIPYGPYENVTIQTVQPYENMVLNRAAAGRRKSGSEPNPPAPVDSSGVYENVDLKATVPPRPLPRQGAALVEPKKRAPIPVPIPIVVPPPRLKPAKPNAASVQSPPSAGSSPATTPLGGEYNTIQSWLQEATEVIHECALTENGEETAPNNSTEEKAPSSPPSVDAKSDADLPRLIDFHPKVSVPLKALEEMDAQAAPPASPVRGGGEEEITSPSLEVMSGGGERYELPPSEAVVRKCIKILSSEDHTYIESSSSDEDEEKLYGRSEDEDDRSSSLSREATTPEQFLSGDGYSDEDGEKLGPPEIVSGGPSEAYFNFPWTSNLLPPIGEVEEEFSSLEHQHNGPIVIINTAEETVINDTNNNQQRERKKPSIDYESAHSTVPSTKIVITGGVGHRIETMSSGKEETKSDIRNRLDDGEALVEQDDGEEDDQDAIDSDDSLEVDSNTIERRSRKLSQAEPTVQQQREVDEDDDASDEKVNSAEAADKTVADAADADPMPAGTELEPSSTCVEEGSVTPPVDGGADTTQLDEAPEDVRTMEPSGGSELAKSANETTVDADDAAISGDVVEDIVVGDTVESDFEELVKAQVEPLDVEDSSEQIQQIHERIIVGIERAVSEEEEEDDVEKKVEVEVLQCDSEVVMCDDASVEDGVGTVTIPAVPVTEEQEQPNEQVDEAEVAKVEAAAEELEHEKETATTEQRPTEQGKLVKAWGFLWVRICHRTQRR